jgi:hypothetical protein
MTTIGSLVRPGAGANADIASNEYRLLGNLVVALALVGFPLAAVLSQLSGLISNELNIGFRVLAILLSVVLLIWSVARGTYRLDPLIAVFFILYSIRLMIDFSYSLLPSVETDSLFFVAVVLIPTLSIGGGHDWFDEETCLRMTLGIGGIAALLITYQITTGGISTDAVVDIDARATLDFLNPISIGYHGLFTAMAGAMLLVKFRKASLVIPCALAIMVGGYLLVISGSRGPFVALLLALAVTGSANRHANATYVIGAIVVAGAITYFGLPEGVVYRFLGAGTDASSLERVYAIQLSIDEAVENPFFGYAYIEPVTGQYPHNLLVEAALALGILGFALMLLKIGRAHV